MGERNRTTDQTKGRIAKLALQGYYAVGDTILPRARFGKLYMVPRYNGQVELRMGRNLIPGNDTLVMLIGLRDGQTGLFISDAQCTFQALANWTGQSGGTIAAGAMNYVQGTNGNYTGVLRGAVGLTPSLNPVAIQVQASNYGFLRRTIRQVAPVAV